MITAFDLRAGMNIAKDNVVAKIQGMDPVWITAAIPESIARLVKDASQFTLTVPARPDKTLTIRNGPCYPAWMPRPARCSCVWKSTTPTRR
ncbi:hypothetical protein ECZU34_45410 [Escherichia coli]|nr:hypothetical protein ECZU34_45410 [Escherichia coli]